MSEKWGIQLAKVKPTDLSREDMKALRDFFDLVLATREFDQDKAFNYDGFKLIKETAMVPIKDIHE